MAVGIGIGVWVGDGGGTACCVAIAVAVAVALAVAVPTAVRVGNGGAVAVDGAGLKLAGGWKSANTGLPVGAWVNTARPSTNKTAADAITSIGGTMPRPSARATQLMS